MGKLLAALRYFPWPTATGHKNKNNRNNSYSCRWSHCVVSRCCSSCRFESYRRVDDNYYVSHSSTCWYRLIARIQSCRCSNSLVFLFLVLFNCIWLTSCQPTETSRILARMRRDNYYVSMWNNSCRFVHSFIIRCVALMRTCWCVNSHRIIIRVIIRFVVFRFVCLCYVHLVNMRNNSSENETR